MSYSGPAPASPLHWGLICLARCLCTLLLLVTFWCHGVTMKWLPSHVAARGGATSGTMRSRWVGAGTQEAPAGRNALTLPPPWLPWNRELVEALLTTSQCLCVPGSSQGLARTRGEERQRHRHSDQGMGALGVIGGNLYILLWPLTQAEIKLCLTHGTVGEWVVCLWQGWHGSAGGTEALLPCYCLQSLQMDDAFKLWKCQRALRIHETTEDSILCTILVCRLKMFWVILCLIVLFIVALDYILMNYKTKKFQEKVWILRLHWLSRCLCYLKLCPLFFLSCTSNTNDSGPLITGSWTVMSVRKKVKVK